MSVKTEYFLKGKSLGIFKVPELSDHVQREQIAKDNGIEDFDKIVLDDGRVIMEKNDIKSFIDSKGNVWYVMIK